MWFSKTFCKPASVVAAMPVGLPVTLQYDERGIIQSYRIGINQNLDPLFQDSDFEPDPELFKIIQGYVPSTINITGGTTWIFGVFYSDRIPCTEGKIPQALYSRYVSQLVEGTQFTFYAGFVSSLAADFTGPVVIRNFLSMNKFNSLPQVIVPVNMTDDTLAMLMNPSTYPFRYEFISGFFIFEEMKCRFAYSNLYQMTVKNEIVPEVGQDGYIKGKIVSENGDWSYLGYSEIVHHSVSKGCTLLFDTGDGTVVPSIVATRVGEGIERVPDRVVKEVNCPVCKKLIIVGTDDAPVQCNDPHCLSHMYDDTNLMLRTFDLDEISYEDYRKAVDKKDVICLTDFLELPQYKDKEITATLAQVLRAAVPYSVCPSYQLLERFANKCNNKADTLVYYLNNPRRIETDLDVIDTMIIKLVNWLEDPYNVSTITTLIDRVKLTEIDAKFEGDPIFRGNIIAVTGKFKRGNYRDICSILRSYAATVVPSIELGQRLPDVIIIGGLHEDMSGQMIQKAKLHQIPIIEEDDFFAEYEIDEDLRKNLL